VITFLTLLMPTPLLLSEDNRHIPKILGRLLLRLGNNKIDSNRRGDLLVVALQHLDQLIGIIKVEDPLMTTEIIEVDPGIIKIKDMVKAMVVEVETSHRIKQTGAIVEQQVVKGTVGIR